ncbi:hypothetical protein [Phenylobacterium sp.]|uniref:hypothetical protein n=1 Tax=Phenylobacterium sp. TaxID=1871053 RepID=UPI00286AA78D|nr:hypothetical protein [Phenylobacterium sp.]
MGVLDEVLNDAQPGYVASVRTILQRFMDALDPTAFDGVAKADFVLHVIDLISHSSLASGHRLQLISDLSSLDWWCDLELGDDGSAALAALARRTYFQEAHAIGFQMERADPAVQHAHCVFAGLLLDVLHSPTRGAFDYIHALAADPDNHTVDVFYSGTLTPALQAYARTRLGASLAKVTFHSIDADPNFLAQAAGSGPRTFHFWCEQAFIIHISLAALVGPTVMFTCGDAAPVQYADVYWYCQDPAYIAKLWRRKGAPDGFADNYRQLESAPFNRSVAKQNRGRAELGFRPEETIIVTVGNRLGVDMDQAFVDGMGALVRDNPEIRWVLVGRMQAFWVEAFESVLGSQFTHIPYDDDLASLLAVCDIFANPFRAGGGNTALMAIDAGAAVITRGDVGDVGAFVPSSHLSCDAESYFAMLGALVDDRALRAAWLVEQQTLLARRLDQDNFARELKVLTQIAFRRFSARIPTSLETIFAQPMPKRLALRSSGRGARLR